MIRVLLVDDHAVVRMGFRLLLQSIPEVSVIAEADSVQRDGPTIGPVETRDEIQQGGLAGTVGTDKSGYLPWLGPHGYITERGVALEVLAYAID